MVQRVGKARIFMDSSGCIDCGTEFSTRWHPAKIAKVTIDGRLVAFLGILRCHECQLALHEKANISARQDA